MLLLKLALRPWRLAMWSQFFSAVAVGFLLLLASLLIWIQQGLKPVLVRLHEEQVVTAYIAPNIEAGNEQGIADAIRTSLGAEAERSEIELVKPDQFVARVSKQYPELGHELEDLGPELTTIVPRYVSIAGVFGDSAVQSIRTVAGIESVESSRDRYRPVAGAFSALRWVARLLAAGLCMALLTGLVHLARTNALIHRDAISVLKLLGASGGRMRIPGVLSGLSVGALGGMIALTGWLTVGIGIARHIRDVSPLLREMPMPSPVFALAVLFVGSLIGLLAGWIAGTTYSTARG